MKEAKRYIHEESELNCNLSTLDYCRVEKAIEKAQKDAYNQALIDAAENEEAYLDYNDIPRVGKQSILKLKKQ